MSMSSNEGMLVRSDLLSETTPAVRRLLVIRNPTAGSYRACRVEAALARLTELGCRVVVRDTAARGDAERFAREADPAETDAVVAAGGDGTINETLNGLDVARMAFGILPCGTANVLAREIAMPMDGRAIGDVLARGRTRRIHLGTANGRRFAMMAGVGLDARAVAVVSPWLKRRLGKLAYGLAILQAVAEARGADLTLTVDGQRLPAIWTVAANGRHYAGGFVMAPQADLGRPTFQVVLCPKGWPHHALRYTASLGIGLLHRWGDIVTLQTDHLTVEGPPGGPVQADGDIVARLPVELAVAKETLNLIVP